MEGDGPVQIGGGTTSPQSEVESSLSGPRCVLSLAGIWRRAAQIKAIAKDDLVTLGGADGISSPLWTPSVYGPTS